MFMCVVNWKSVNKLDLTWKQSFLIIVRIKCIDFERKKQYLILKNKKNYLRPSEVDGSPKGVSVKFACAFVNVSNNNLQLPELLGTEVTKGSCNRLSKILFGRILVGDFSFGEEDLRKEGDGRGEEV